MGKLREVREVRGKLRDKCPNFKLEDYCLFTSRTTVGSDNFFNFCQFPHFRNLNYHFNQEFKNQRIRELENFFLLISWKLRKKSVSLQREYIRKSVLRSQNNESEKSSANCGIFSYRGAYSLQNLLDKKKEVFVNKEYVRPFNHRTAP